MLLDLDHGNSTAKVIWMLYQVLHIIVKKERDQLLLEILAPESFYKYMFHWSWLVRVAFNYFYYFQLQFMLVNDDEVM